MDDDDLRLRVKAALQRAPAPGAPDMAPVVDRARRLRGRRVVVAGVAAAVAAAAVVVPLALLAGLGGGPSAGSAAALPDAVRVVCDATGTRILTPEARPQPDGIHFRVDNRTAGDLSFQVADAGGSTAPAGLHEPADPRSGGSGWTLAPGRIDLRCQDESKDAGSKAGYVSVRILDPRGLWVSTRLGCQEVAGGSIDYKPDARGGSDPVAMARQHFEGLHSDDVVERAGFPEQAYPTVRVVRGGQVIATADFHSDGHGGWLLDQTMACVGALQGY